MGVCLIGQGKACRAIYIPLPIVSRLKEGFVAVGSSGAFGGKGVVSFFFFLSLFLSTKLHLRSVITVKIKLKNITISIWQR